MQVHLFWYCKSTELIVLYPAVGFVRTHLQILLPIQRKFKQFDQPPPIESI